MSLVSCPECQKEVSSLALACAHCAYPYPGKMGFSDQKLQACTECGGVVSKKAQSCPHCGISFTTVPKNTVDEETAVESWLCSNCGTPYTQKIRKPSKPILPVEDQPSDSQEPPVTDGRGLSFAPNVPKLNSVAPPEPISKVEVQPSDSQKPPVTDGRGLSFAPNVPKLDPVVPRAGRHRSPLWFPPATTQGLASSPSPQRKKSTIVVGMVVVFLIVLSLVLWVLWQPNGINPFDLLPMFTQSINNLLLSVQQGGP